jgi:hypothetical protein
MVSVARPLIAAAFSGFIAASVMPADAAKRQLAPQPDVERSASFILTLTPHYVARAIGKTAPTDIQNYAEHSLVMGEVSHWFGAAIGWPDKLSCLGQCLEDCLGLTA